MSEFYVYESDNDMVTESGPNVEFMEPETDYYGVPMRFSKIKETQFKTIMSNIGNNPAIIDFNQSKTVEVPMESVYGDVGENVVSNYPDSSQGYLLTETSSNSVNTRLTTELVDKYSRDGTSIWVPRMSNSKTECNWFIDPTDWTVRTFGNGKVMGKITNLEGF